MPSAKCAVRNYLLFYMYIGETGRKFKKNTKSQRVEKV